MIVLVLHDESNSTLLLVTIVFYIYDEELGLSLVLMNDDLYFGLHLFFIPFLFFLFYLKFQNQSYLCM